MAFKEKYGTVSKASNTQVQLTDSVIKIGGQFYRTGSKTLNTLTDIDPLDSTTELVKNGTFDTDLSFWTFPNGTSGITWVAGQVNMAVGSARLIEQAIVTIPGVSYQLFCNYNNITNSTGPATGAFAALYTGTNATGTLLAQYQNTPGTGPGTITLGFTATTTTTYVYISLGDGADAATFDNISVKSLTPTIAPSTFYYLYAKRSSGVTGLTASKNSQKPPSYASYKKIGAFYTDTAGSVFRAYTVGEVNQTALSAKISSTKVVSEQNVPWLASASVVATSTQAIPMAGIFSLRPNGLAGKDNQNGAANYEYAGSTASVLSFYVTNYAGAATTADSISVFMQKQGVDATQPDWRDY